MKRSVLLAVAPLILLGWTSYSHAQPDESNDEADEAPAPDESGSPAPTPTPDETPAPESDDKPLPPTFPTKATDEDLRPTPSEQEPKDTDEDTYEDSRLESPEGEKDPVSPFLFGVLWDHSFPLGKSRDLVRNYSLRGFAFEGRYQGLKNFGLGFRIAWNTMEEKETSTYTQGALTVTGTQLRTLSASPMFLTVSYGMPRDRVIRPYVMFGAGGARVLRQLDLGISRYLEESWHWAVAPEMGLEIPTDYLVVMAAARMNALFATKEAPSQLYLSFSLGLGFD